MPSARRGEPEAATGSLNSICMAIASPSVYTVPSPGEDTETTDGIDVSIAMRLRYESEEGSPGSGSARPATLPAPSMIVPPPASRAFLPS